MKRLKAFFAELVRRRVFRLLGAYLVLLWLLAQGFAALYPAVGLPPWSLTAFLIVGVCLIPVLAVLSWKYNIVAPQIVRDTKDVEAANPGHKYAARRHSPIDCGVVLLRWSDGGDVTHEKQTARVIAIGREPGNDIELADPRVSRHHAVIWAERGEWFVRDMDSACGTFVDDEQIDGTVKLSSKCRLQFHPEGPTVKFSIIKSSETVMQLPDTAPPTPPESARFADTEVPRTGS